MRILLAEDEKDLNKIITARLKDEYYSVDCKRQCGRSGGRA